MTKLVNEFSVSLPDNGKELRFNTTKDLLRWANAELAPYQGIDAKRIGNSNLRSIWDQHISFFNHVIENSNQFDQKIKLKQEGEAKSINDSIRNSFSNVSNGIYITSGHELYPAIFDLARTSPDLGAILLVTLRKDSTNTLGQLGQFGIGFNQIIKLAINAARSKGSRDWLQPQRKELAALKDESQSTLDSIRKALDDQNAAIATQRDDEATEHEARLDQWQGIKDSVASDWEKLKKVYDEQLALAAPTQYWNTRAKNHRNAAISFAGAFTVTLGASICAFAHWAMPHLLEVAGNKDISPILTLIPIAIPAFAVIWVLKMLSRLLSENLQMMRDARERETMVKTFLALMHDDTAGKSLINDNDRILILHSLFRPSSVTAADDAPPVHWFDILTNKVGASTAKK